jgi:hypothetical protein
MILLGLPDFHSRVYVSVRRKSVWKRFLEWTEISLAQYQNLTTKVTYKNDRLGSWSNSVSIWMYVHFHFPVHVCSVHTPLLFCVVCVCQVGVWNCLVQEICFWSVPLKITPHYKPAGRGFDSWWCHWNSSVTILLVTLWPWGWLSL